ncbi:lipid A deacylase LpxR family protein [Pelagicoccus sp. SDUM812002]|uniref:lipid A deacylase LpxR family protein n=1 Tax=Pelagicoccus sp. SDUM812002 TaxID=3041266 RepID=UPI00280CE5FE|nr:lipid A deacylase LpxR family protein [Pelagicoccus sp. SDUM812002]MDQ8186598.1 lipid A deacylase LpxR family protein [Pelagicoccus sp. SDUM812002]
MTISTVRLKTRQLIRGTALLLTILVGTTLEADREIDSFTIRMENDAPAGTDSRYTAGTEFDFAYRPYNKPNESASYHTTLALGQLIFTPENLVAEEIVKDDRPYAGWSYLRYGTHKSTYNSLKSWQLTLGLVGPSSFAEDIQRAVHELIDDRMPLGWHNQLSDEFGYAIEHSRSKTHIDWQLGDELNLQFSESNRVSLGNIDSSLSQGFQIRFGKRPDIAHSFDRIGSPATGVTPRAPYLAVPKELRPSRVYWVLGGKMSYVAQNLFIDGNSNGRSHSVTRNPWVQEVETGLSYSKPGFKLSALMIYRSEEFREQEGGQSFASVSLTFRR